MRILYFSQFYSLENIAPAFRATDHAYTWAQAGHDVTVFTGWPNYPTGHLFDGYQMTDLGEEQIGGVHIYRSASRILPNTSFKNRIVSGISYIVNGFRNLGSKSPVGYNYDVVLVTCGTVFAAWLGVYYARRYSLPLVVEFRDLTYRQMIATGSKGIRVAAMKALELSFCRKANHVVVLTPGFRTNLIAEGVPYDRLSVVPNGAELVACRHQWQRPLRFGYFGTMGLSQNVPMTVEYIRHLKEDGLAASYVLIGEGAARSGLEQWLQNGSYDYVELEHGVPMVELETHYADVDMTVVSLQKSEAFSSTIPSKIFQSLARGVPVLFIGPEGDAATLIRDSGAGVVLCGSAEEDLHSLRAFAAREDLVAELERMSAAAIRLVECHYSRRHLAEEMARILSDAAGIEMACSHGEGENG